DPPRPAAPVRATVPPPARRACPLPASAPAPAARSRAVVPRPARALRAPAAVPVPGCPRPASCVSTPTVAWPTLVPADAAPVVAVAGVPARSEEHTSELQSRFDLVCRLLLEKK